jgi:hypothetical protein
VTESRPAPDWYPDPDGTSQGHASAARAAGRRDAVARLWHGRARRTKALIVTAVVAVWVLIVAGLVLLIHRDGTPRLAIAAKPPPLSTTSMEDWTKSVCESGSFQDGTIGSDLPAATGIGHCTAVKGTDVIMVGTYAARRLLDNDMTHYRGAVYATIRLTSDEIFAFVAPLPADRSVLDPLTRYGFTIHGR